MNYNNRFFKYSVAIILVLLILFLLTQISYILVPLKKISMIFILPVIGAGVFYYLLRPLVRYLAKKGVNKTISVAIVFLGVIATFTVFIAFGGAAFRNEFWKFYNDFSKQLQIAQESTQNILDQGKWWIFSMSDLREKAIAGLEFTFSKLGQNITGVLSTIANVGTIIVLIPFVSFFLLKDENFFYNNFIKIVPKRHKEGIVKILRDIDKTLSIYITGQLIVALVLGILTYIGYLIIGLPNALILALFSMITSVIPFLGPFLGVLPAVFIGLTIDFSMILKILLVLLIVQQLEGNVIRPNVMGQRLQIHPLTVIFLVIMAISLYGVIGAFVAIPTYAVIRVIVKHYFWPYINNED